MTLASGIDVSSEAIASLCRRYRIDHLELFGSAARGDLHEASDIDLAVEFQAGYHPGLAWFDLEEELSALFHRRVDLSRKSLLKPRVARNAARDAIILYAA